MSTKSTETILAETRSFMQKKQAQFNKQAVDQALTNPGSIPGSEHDRPAPSVSSDPEVKQELPPGGGAATCAEVLESGHATPSGEGAIPTTEKPLISADAMKSGSVAKQANDLLASIRQFQSVKSASDAGEVGALQEAPKPAASAKVANKAGDVPKASTPDGAAATEAPACESKAAGVNDLDLTQDVLAKIASMILATEEGWDFVESTMSKAAGADAARELIGTLTKEAEAQQAQEAYEQGIAAADEYVKQACYQAGYEQALREAGVPMDKSAQHQQELINLGYMVADEAVKMAQDAMAAEEGGETPDSDDPGAGAVPGADEAAGEMASAPEEDISPEDLQQALEMLVQDGQIQPEEAAQIMEYISGAGAMGGEEGGMPPEAMGGEEGGMPPEALGGMPPEAAAGGMPPEAGMEVAASHRRITDLAYRISHAVHSQR